jgi:hypothetical protein
MPSRVIDYSFEKEIGEVWFGACPEVPAEEGSVNGGWHLLAFR